MVGEMPCQNQQNDWLANESEYTHTHSHTNQQRKKIAEKQSKNAKVFSKWKQNTTKWKKKEILQTKLFAIFFFFFSFFFHFISFSLALALEFQFFYFIVVFLYFIRCMFGFVCISLCAFVSFLDFKFTMECFADFFRFFFVSFSHPLLPCHPRGRKAAKW